MMKAHTWMMILCLAVLGGFLYHTAQADEWNKKTTITFDQPVEVPGQVLPAGTYTFKLLDSQSDRHIVQVFNKDETHLYATILAIPNYRLQPTGKTVIGFEERPAGQPEALQAWFYPGDNFGQEFVYPKNRAAELAKTTNQTVYSMPNEMASNTTQPSESANENSVQQMEQAPVTSMQPSGEEQQMAQATPPPPPAEQEAERQAPETAAPAETPAPAETSAPAPRHMPKTASDTWLYLLIGLSSAAAGLKLYNSAQARS